MSALPSHLTHLPKRPFLPHFIVVFILMLLPIAVGQGQARALDLNLASKEQLLGLKGIGGKTADKILTARQDQPFRSTSDFKSRVPGFGVKKLQKLREQGLTIGGQPLDVPATGELAGAARRTASRRASLSSPALPALPVLIKPTPAAVGENGPGPATASGKTR